MIAVTEPAQTKDARWNLRQYRPHEEQISAGRPETIAAIKSALALTPTEAAKRLAAWRWPNGRPYCPDCGADRPYTRGVGSVAGTPRYKCRRCHKGFSVFSRSAIHHPKCPANYYVAMIEGARDETLSALQLGLLVGKNYKWVWALRSKLRLDAAAIPNSITRWSHACRPSARAVDDETKKVFGIKASVQRQVAEFRAGSNRPKVGRRECKACGFWFDSEGRFDTLCNHCAEREMAT